MKFKFKRFYLWFLLPLTVIFLWIFIFYMPFSAKIKQKEKEIAAVKQEIRVIEQDINNSIDIKRKGDQIKASMHEIQMQLPTIDVFPEFMIKLLKSIKKESIKLSSLVIRLQFSIKNSLSFFKNSLSSSIKLIKSSIKGSLLLKLQFIL